MFNWVDLVLIGFLIYFVVTNSGFIDTALEVISFVLSLFAAYKFYTFTGKLLVSNFSLPHGISNALGFFITWIVTEIILSLALIFLLSKLFKKIRDNKLNLYLGFVAAFVQTAAIYLFVISLVFALPVRPQIKKDILESKSGTYFVSLSQDLEKKLNSVLNDAVLETINFLTIRPLSDETVNMGFKVTKKSTSIDNDSETLMLTLVNQERVKEGLTVLSSDNKLKKDARFYAEEMLMNGFFSHVSLVDGSTPSVRADKFNVIYSILGENLAYAPDVYIAHQGLMNSPGHRANILSIEYSHVGMGIIDAGIYGKMFVQEFSD